jgi:hypothetical protein
MRLPRLFLSVALLAALLPGSLAAMDRGTSFSSGNLRGWIDPETGLIRLCEDQDGVLVPVSFSSFLMDLELLRYRPGKEVDGKTQSTLRQGAANWLPLPADVLANFPAKPPKSAGKTDPEAKSYQALALKAEDDFWSKLPDYDGKATVAVQQPWLMLAIPGWHILVLYEIRDQNQPPRLTSWRNVGPDLMLPQGFKTTPTPQSILDQLPPEVRAAYGDTVKEANVKAAGGKDAGGKNTVSGTMPPPTPGAFWVASGGRDMFVLVDPTTLRLVTYQVSNKTITLKAARDCTIDLLITTAFSKNAGSKKATAPTASPIEQLVLRHKEELTEIHFTPDAEELAAFIETEGKPAKASGGADTGAATEDKGPDVAVRGSTVTIRDQKRGKTASYRIDGPDDKLELVSMRDDSYGQSSTGIALLEDYLAKRRFAQSAYEQARDLKGQNEAAFTILRFALHMDPLLLPKMQEDLRLISLRRKPEWKEIAEQAEKDAATALEQRAARIKRAEELRAEKREKAKQLKTQ